MVNRISWKGVLAIAFLCLATYLFALAGTVHADTARITIDPVPVNGYVEDNNGNNIDNISCGSGGRTDCGQVSFDDGDAETVRLVATPDACYQFDNWTGMPGSSTQNPKTYQSEDYPNVTGTANFSKIVSNLTITVVGSGIVTPNTIYVFDDVVWVSAMPDPGWRFVNWTGPGVGNLVDPNAAGTNLINPLCGDTDITATFVKINYNLTTTQVGMGTVTPSTTYNFDSGLAITATPDPTWGFVNWTGDTANLVDPNAASTNLINPLFSDTNVTANFGLLGRLQIDNATWGGGTNNVIIEWGGNDI